MMNQPIELSRARVAESSFFSQVYLWMAGGLLVSALGAFFVLSNPAMLKAIVTSPMLLLALVLVEVGLVVWLSAAIARLSLPTALTLYGVYSFLNGVTLSFVFLVYTGASVVTTFAITAGTFIFFSVYGQATKTDLTRVGNLAMMGLIGVILASVVNIFLKSPAVYWAMTYIGIAVFLGLVAYDNQKLKMLYQAGFDSHESQSKTALLGALQLYLDFINLFILLLRLFGQERNK